MTDTLYIRQIHCHIDIVIVWSCTFAWWYQMIWQIIWQIKSVQLNANKVHGQSKFVRIQHTILVNVR